MDEYIAFRAQVKMPSNFPAYRLGEIIVQILGKCAENLPALCIGVPV